MADAESNVLLMLLDSISELEARGFCHDRRMSLAAWRRADAAARRCRQATGAKLSGKCPGPADLILASSLSDLRVLCCFR